jgi:hypothetical protein
MTFRHRILAILVVLTTMSLNILVSAQAQVVRSARLVSPTDGEIVVGPNVTFRVESSGVRLPDEHFHLLIDGAALEYISGNPIPLGRVDMVHFRAATTTVRMSPGPHFVVLIATDSNHVPLRPWVGSSAYFFVR